MNEATGGSVDVKGDLDFNPDKMWYMFEYFIGGAGKFVERTKATAMKLKAKAEDNDIGVRSQRHPIHENPVRRTIKVHGHGGLQPPSSRDYAAHQGAKEQPKKR